ncbi:hypothetical protein [Melaminivora alkalimesophila]|uniref:Uncharacterized protein n=1 Tax=Melaminivora alkalimesophila TaxID=1165852 RepID=A0A317RCY2_9BURK|nr:hypothetical protein [Melaminivora alkalimesophila]PWW47776.1 hypothetical protein DFR36_102152 [Melaminivora alkalimesophila]
MPRIPDSRIEDADPPIHPRKVPASQDRRRAVWIIVAAIALTLLVGALARLVAPREDPYLPESREATGAHAPAIPVPPAR